MLYQFGVKSLGRLHDVHDRFQAIMRKVAREEGVRVVDTASRCRAVGDEACFNEYDLVHPSGNGHRVIAEAVRDALVEEEMIDGEVISERRAGADRW